MRILISNDDGVYARGIDVLRKELSRRHEVWVVAPLDEHSTRGHGLTLHKPLRLEKVGERVFGVSGTPADSVLMGLNQVLKKRKPDLVISGINRGANLGQDVFYSGTVAAAREASMQGFPSIAVSLVTKMHVTLVEERLNYPAAAKVTAQLIQDLLKNKLFDPLSEGVALNLNVPDRPFRSIKGILLSEQGKRHYTGTIYKRRDHRGKEYFWLGGKYKGFSRAAGTDCVVVNDGFASLTPHKLDTTDRSGIRFLTQVFDCSE